MSAIAPTVATATNQSSPTMKSYQNARSSAVQGGELYVAPGAPEGDDDEPDLEPFEEHALARDVKPYQSSGPRRAS